MTELEKLKKELQDAIDTQILRELGNDMYYSSWQYKEDEREIFELKQKIKELEK
jgi:hypothetical protein